MSKIYSKTTWVDEVLANAAKYLVKDDAGETVYNNALIELATEVVTAGTGVTAATMQNIEDGIDALDTQINDTDGIADTVDALDNILTDGTGWSLVSDTWTYASATTITVPSGAEGIYSVGDKIRFKQGAGYKYFYVVTVADTLLTVTGGSDYTVNTPTAITDIYYSKATSPVRFPQKFNYTPTLTNIAGGTIDVAKFMLVGRRASLAFRYTFAGADISGSVSVSLPINAADMNFLNIIGSITFRDSNPATNYYGVVLASSTTIIFTVAKADGTYATLANVSSTIPFTWAAGDLIMVEASYFI